MVWGGVPVMRSTSSGGGEISRRSREQRSRTGLRRGEQARSLRGRAFREAIALRGPTRPWRTTDLGAVLGNSGHYGVRGGRAVVPRGQGALAGGL